MRMRCTISLILAVLFASTTVAQNSRVDFSAFDMGFEVLPSSASGISSAVGQSMVQIVEERNARIESGFLNSSFLRTGIVVAGRADTAILGSPVAVTILVPSNTQTFAESLFYRKAGETAFGSIAMQRRGDTLAAAIPSTAVTIRGVEYFVRAFSAQGFPIRFPQAGVDGIRVRVNQFNSPVALTSRLYRMISVPADLNDSSALGVLFDDLGQYSPIRWRLFRWEKDRNVEHPAIRSRFTPGKSFWLITQSARGFDIDNGLSVASVTPVVLDLDTGWNQIASPYAFRVKWPDSTSTTLSRPYFYDGTSPYTPGITVLEPWEGYFVENRSGQSVRMLIPPLETASGNLPKMAGPIPPMSSNDFVLQLSAELENGVQDIYNYMGFLEQATAGDDHLDLHEPPPMGEYVQMSVVEGKSFLSNYKPLTGAGQQWELNIRSTFSNPIAKVSTHQFGALPAGFDIYVFDKDEFNRIPIQSESFAVQLKEGMSIRSLRVIIGTEDFATEHSGGIPLVPFEYSLAQNYPNPFNPSTTINYSLKKRSDVVLEIYNMIGQRVKTLATGEQVTGSYSILWDGTNNAGTPVASGVYIYRLRADEFRASRKMLLLR